MHKIIRVFLCDLKHGYNLPCNRDNQHTNQVGNTLYDVGLKAGDTVVDVAGQVENTIDETEIPEIDFLKLEE